MSLTRDDAQQIRGLFTEYLMPFNDHLEAIENDIKEIYDMLSLSD